MKKPGRRITVYLNDAAYGRLIDVARTHRRSLSGHIKHLMENSSVSAVSPKDELLRSLNEIQIAVDELVRNHPNTKLFDVVTAVRQARRGEASHEA
jgi:hypothetical protein